MEEELRSLKKEVEKLSSENRLLRDELNIKSQSLTTTQSHLMQEQEHYRELLDKLVELNQSRTEAVKTAQDVSTLQAKLSKLERVNDENGELKRENELLLKRMQTAAPASLQKTVLRLRQADEDNKDLQTEMVQIRSELRRARNETSKWRHFAEDVLDDLSEYVDITKFSLNETEEQQRAIRTAINNLRLSRRSTPNYQDDEPLKEVHRRCDRMLGIIDSNGAQRRANKSPESEIRELHEITKRLKNEYREIRRTERNRDRMLRV